MFIPQCAPSFAVFPARDLRAATRLVWVVRWWLVLVFLPLAMVVHANPIPPVPALTAPAQAEATYTVSWNGSTGAEYRYDLEESANGGTSWTRQRLLGLSKSFTKTTSGARLYRVSACYSLPRGDGGDGTEYCSAFSSAKTVNVYVQPTAAPSLSCTAGCTSPNINGSVSLSWTEPSGTTDFRLMRRRNGGAWTVAVHDDAVRFYTFGSLADGTWDFKVDACNTLTDAARSCSPDSVIKTVEVLITPSSPTGLSLPSTNTNGIVTVSWAASTGSVSRYEVLRLNHADPDPHYELVQTVTSPTGPVPTSTVITGHPDGTFNYRVRACNSASCSLASDPRQITVLKVPTIPGGLTVPSSSNSGSITLTWVASTETVERYDVLRHPQLDGGVCPGAVSSYAVVGTTSGISKSFIGHEDGAYCFRVQACNASGCAVSAAVTVAVAKTLEGLEDGVVPNLSLPTADAVGTLPGQSGQDGGKVTYSVSLPVPPGRHGLGPQVSLNYSSGAGEGLLGVGWSLSAGQGSVYRCASLEAIDGETRPYSGQTTDRLCLDGEQLILVPGSGSYGGSGSRYHPETKPFVTVALKNGSSLNPTSYFEVMDRSGMVHIYGKSRVPARLDGATGYPTHWLLTVVQDLNGNRIDYKYAAGEEDLLDRVVYTGHGASEGSRIIQFGYEARPQRLEGYNAQGYRTLNTQRLKSITTSVAGAVVNHVRLRYETSDLSGRSLLKGIQLCKDSGCGLATSFPESVFSYSEQPQTFTRHTLLAEEFSRLVDIGDIDGDGRRDYMLWSQASPLGSMAPVEIRLSSQSTPLPVEGWQNTQGSGDPMIGPHRPHSDFNSDGRDDLIGTIENGALMVGIWRLSPEGAQLDRLPTNQVLDESAFVTDLLDVDRDGDTDVVVRDGRYGSDSVYVNTTVEQSSHQGAPSQGELYPQFRFTQRVLPGGPSNVTFSNASFQDINGDLLPDRLYETSSMGGPTDTYVRFGELTSDGYYTLGALRHLQDDLGGPPRINQGNIRWLDVNGDGLQDIFKHSNGSNDLWLNIGGRFMQVTLSGGINFDSDLAGGLVVMDYDHDGRDDLLAPTVVAPGSGSTFCYTYYYDVGGEQESEFICSGSGGDSRFEEGNHPELNRGLYVYDQVRFVQQADGRVALAQSATSLTGVIHHSQACDANDDGLTDLCYQQKGEYVQANHCNPDDLDCVQQVGQGGGPVGSYASLNTRTGAFGFDLLTQATNGMGVQERWDYGALSGGGDNRCVYSAGQPFYSVDLDGAMPGHYHFNAAMHVVTRHQASNGVGAGMNVKCLRYEDAMFSTGGRGFQGFKAIIADEHLGDGHDKTVRTEYYDYFPLTGKPYRVQVRLRGDSAAANPLSETYTEWNYAERTDGTWYAYLEGTLEVTYNADEPGRPAMTRKGTAYGYDATDLANGNRTSESSVLKTLSAAGDTLVVNRTDTAFEYDYSEVGSGWYDKLIKKTLTAHATTYGALEGPQPDTASNNTEVVTEDYRYYSDGTRQLQSKTVQDGVASQEVTRSYQYDVWGNTQRITDEAPGFEKRVVVTFFGGDGYFMTYQTAGGFTTVFAYNDSHGQLESQDNPDGTRVEHDYDFAGRPVQTRTSVGQPVHYIAQWCTQACGGAIAKTTVMQAGSPDRVTYVDLLGRTLQTRTTGFEAEYDTVVTVAYDARGRKVAESQPGQDAGGHLTQYLDYDALGRYGRKVVDRSGHALASQTWYYDYQGLTTVITLPDGSLTATRTYDAGERLLSTTDAMGSTTYHRYDGLGQKVLTQNALGTQVRYFFDALGRKVRTEDPDAGTSSQAAETLVYNGYGELVQSVNANNAVISTQYDVLGRPVLRQVNGVVDARWVYDANGTPTLSSQESGDSDGDGVPDAKKSFDYDSYGRLIRMTVSLDGSPRSFVDLRAYDANYGRLKGRMYASGEMVYYKYDDHGYLTKELRPWSRADGGHEQYYTIDAQNARGQIEQIRYPNGTRGLFTYVESTGDVESMLYEKVQSGTALADLRYYYNDAFGNLSRREDVVVGAAESFTYDHLQRLDGSNTVWSNAAIAPRVVDYDYDAVGNLIKKDDFGRVYHYGNSSRDAGGNAGPHAVRRVELANGGVLEDFRYDAAGNMTAGKGRTVTYNAFNKPVQISEAGKISQFVYGPDLALAVRKEMGKTIYYGDDYQLVVNGGVQEERTYIGQHVVVEKTGGVRKERYQHYDRLGSLVLVTDEEGNATENHAFDAFGQPLKGDWQTNGGLLHAGTGTERLTETGYTGHEHLDDHKLVHMGGRVYDPNLGRFLSVDPLIQSETSTQSQNPYTYVMNNPLSNIDPSGYACVVSTDGEGGNLRHACESDTTPGSVEGRSPEDWAAVRYARQQVASGRTFENGAIISATSRQDGTYSFTEKSLSPLLQAAAAAGPRNDVEIADGVLDVTKNCLDDGACGHAADATVDKLDDAVDAAKQAGKTSKAAIVGRSTLKAAKSLVDVIVLIEWAQEVGDATFADDLKQIHTDAVNKTEKDAAEREARLTLLVIAMAQDRFAKSGVYQYNPGSGDIVLNAESRALVAALARYEAYEKSGLRNPEAQYGDTLDRPGFWYLDRYLLSEKVLEAAADGAHVRSLGVGQSYPR